ncbi:MAG: acetylxylan esterase [Planctomycetota bacterium]
MLLVSALVVAASSTAQSEPARDDAWSEARARGELSQRAVLFCLRYADGWLAHADPTTGLLPRTLTGEAYWNAKDCAADNYPFLAITAHVTGLPHLLATSAHILAQERRLTATPLGLPDDFVFADQARPARTPSRDELVFGAAEYVKDGLLPLLEWTGDEAYRTRSVELLRAIVTQAAVASPAGSLPSDNLEVNGDLLQAFSRAAWLTGDAAFATMAFRLGDHYLLHEPLLAAKALPLRDHGCEVIGGLTEAYVLAAHRDPERRARWRPPLHALLDVIAAHGVRDDGLLHEAIDPKTGRPTGGGASDGWGYVLDAFVAVGALEPETPYADVARRCLARVAGVDIAHTPGLGGADGAADTLEGAINLLARFDDRPARAWVDREMDRLLGMQRADGILEAWYGDGNSARTAWMWALMQTCGIHARPWRPDLALGAEATADGGVRVVLRAEFAWEGELRFDRPRHRDLMHLPLDYARINQWPQWFTVDTAGAYAVARNGTPTQHVAGATLLGWPLSLRPKEEVRLEVRAETPPPRRRARFAVADADADTATRWQQRLRAQLLGLLRVDTLLDSVPPLAPEAAPARDGGGVTQQDVEFQSTPGRRVVATLSTPSPRPPGRLPAVVCIHGHGGTRASVADPESAYRGFATMLARRGFVTIACDVGQHEVREPGRTLMGERLWDLRRCVDLLASRDDVDPERIGCAGLSLGGEMAMWLGALDTRIAAVASCGFLTTMDQMEQGHCRCWDFDGLRQLVDWPDVYALIAPRPLQCQNGTQESAKDFCVPLARVALREIAPAYRVLGAPDALSLHVHRGGHVVDAPALLAFCERWLLR